MLGQLPTDRLEPGSTSDWVGVDYAGPVLLKRGFVRKHVLSKACICVFVYLAVKALHLELVFDLTSEAFIGTRGRFIPCRGNPSLIQGDNGTDFVGEGKDPKLFAESRVRTKGVWLLFHAGNCLEVHSRTSASFWWTLGGSGKIDEVSLMEDCWWN